MSWFHAEWSSQSTVLPIFSRVNHWRNGASHLSVTCVERSRLWLGPRCCLRSPLAVCLCVTVCRGPCFTPLLSRCRNAAITARRCSVKAASSTSCLCPPPSSRCRCAITAIPSYCCSTPPVPPDDPADTHRRGARRVMGLCLVSKRRVHEGTWWLRVTLLRYHLKKKNVSTRWINADHVQIVKWNLIYFIREVFFSRMSPM